MRATESTNSWLTYEISVDCTYCITPAFSTTNGNLAEKHHPKGVPQAYIEIGSTLSRLGFKRIQGSLYVTDDENMANLFRAITALKSLSWFPASVLSLSHKYPRQSESSNSDCFGALEPLQTLESDIWQPFRTTIISQPVDLAYQGFQDL